MVRLFLLLIATLFSLTGSVLAAPEQVFGNRERAEASVRNLPQWKRLIDDFALQATGMPTAELQAWDLFMRSVEDAPPVSQILKVNAWFNQFPYKQDNWLYGKNDHWANPIEFLQKGGDCEDYVIAKYITLRLLGFSPESLHISMVYDIFSGTDHAFLIASHDGETFVLDNRDTLTTPAHYSARYKPHYIFNEQSLWTYDSPVIVKFLRKDQEEPVLPGNR